MSKRTELEPERVDGDRIMAALSDRCGSKLICVFGLLAIILGALGRKSWVPQSADIKPPLNATQPGDNVKRWDVQSLHIVGADIVESDSSMSLFLPNEDDWEARWCGNPNWLVWTLPDDWLNIERGLSGKLRILDVQTGSNYEFDVPPAHDRFREWKSDLLEFCDAALEVGFNTATAVWSSWHAAYVLHVSDFGDTRMWCYRPLEPGVVSSPFAGLLPSESQLIDEIAVGEHRVGFVTSSLNGVSVTTDMLDSWSVFDADRMAPDEMRAHATVISTVSHCVVMQGDVIAVVGSTAVYEGSEVSAIPQENAYWLAVVHPVSGEFLGSEHLGSDEEVVACAGFGFSVVTVGSRGTITIVDISMLPDGRVRIADPARFACPEIDGIAGSLRSGDLLLQSRHDGAGASVLRLLR